MTDEEKAEEYLKDICPICNDREACLEDGCNCYIKDAYLDGLAEGRKEKCLEQNIDGTIRLCEVMKENMKLKESVEDWKTDHEYNFELMKGLNDRIEELKENIENLEYENGCLKMEVMCVEKSKEIYKKIAEQLQEKLREISNCVQTIDFTQSQFFIEKIKELAK